MVEEKGRVVEKKKTKSKRKNPQRPSKRTEQICCGGGKRPKLHVKGVKVPHGWTPGGGTGFHKADGTDQREPVGATNKPQPRQSRVQKAQGNANPLQQTFKTVGNYLKGGPRQPHKEGPKVPTWGLPGPRAWKGRVGDGGLQNEKKTLQNGKQNSEKKGSITKENVKEGRMKRRPRLWTGLGKARQSGTGGLPTKKKRTKRQ